LNLGRKGGTATRLNAYSRAQASSYPEVQEKCNHLVAQSIDETAKNEVIADVTGGHEEF
jgi:hypothetical protein